MTEDHEDQETPSELGKILDGFLLKALLGKEAQRALGRLIGGVTAIPTAYLESKAQKIHDRAKADSLVSHAIAKKIAKAAGDDPALIQRALERFSIEYVGEQKNREAIGRFAAEDLGHRPSASDQPVDEEWLNKFGRYANDVSSDEMQRLWGMLLAGEIRAPGSTSLRTLHLLSMLDSATAKTFERFAPWILGDVLPQAPVTGLRYDDYLLLEENDLITGVVGSMHKTYNISEGSFQMIPLSNKAILLSKQASITACRVTRGGLDLLKLISGIDASVSVNAVAEALYSRSPQFLMIGDLIDGEPRNLFKYPLNGDFPVPDDLPVDLQVGPDGLITIAPKTA
jgi:hypothetical protein